jgi:hypothetical protein
MLRLLSLLLAVTVLPVLADDDIRPVISIASPDTATTFVYGTIKSRALIWSDSKQTLSAEITFVDEQQTTNQPNDDTHRFRLPGIALDKAHGVFYATSPKGEVSPIARRKKTLFITSIEVLPNAIVRVNHHRGEVTVELEAIRPDDVARLRKAQAAQDAQSNPDGNGGHTINLQDLLP